MEVKDMIVQWDKDGSTNTVSVDDVTLACGDTRFEVGSRVKFPFAGQWWFGKVIETDVSSSPENSQETLCEVPDCNVGIFAACPYCTSLLCHDHFVGDCLLCFPTHVTNNDQSHQPNPEDFSVEGNSQETLPSQIQCVAQNENERKSRRAIVKQKRNLGVAYTTEKSNKLKAERKLKDKCKMYLCKEKGYLCGDLTRQHRETIFLAYWSSGILKDQREWLSRHVKVSKKAGKRKQRKICYFLPTDCGQIQVCRVMFINTIGISETALRTVLNKTDESGIMEGEKRGGRVSSLAARDRHLRDKVIQHIQKFPKMESHYCRQETKFQYLSSDLTLQKMFKMYEQEADSTSKVTFRFYQKVFSEMNLRFHKPIKDTCGLCETYRRGSIEEKNKLEQRYNLHINEKVKVRSIKKQLKSRAKINKAIFVGTFDLQQVILLPKSNRSDVFYSRRLSCYNFTVSDLNCRESEAFMWHEGIGKRGANEIASCLFNYLKFLDSKRVVEHVFLFSDGCSGQNKNSIIPAMFRFFLQSSVKIRTITLHIFEPHHGQNEGDSVHSCVERAMKRVGDIFVPSELITVVKLCRKKMKRVVSLNTRELQDWKRMSKEMRILRVREGTDGTEIDWTKVRQIMLKKAKPGEIYFKMNHSDNEFSSLDLTTRRSFCAELEPPMQAYDSPPKLASAKYEDLLKLTEGDFPVIGTEYATFYRGLPH